MRQSPVVEWYISTLSTKDQFLFRMDLFMCDYLKLKRKTRYLHILPFLSVSWDIFAGVELQIKRIEGRE